MENIQFDHCLEEPTLRQRIEHAINSTSSENGCNTPDFILAEYLEKCLQAFDSAVKARDGWYAIKPSPGWNHKSEGQCVAYEERK